MSCYKSLILFLPTLNSFQQWRTHSLFDTGICHKVTLPKRSPSHRLCHEVQTFNPQTRSQKKPCLNKRPACLGYYIIMIKSRHDVVYIFRESLLLLIGDLKESVSITQVRGDGTWHQDGGHVVVRSDCIRSSFLLETKTRIRYRL